MKRRLIVILIAILLLIGAFGALALAQTEEPIPPQTESPVPQENESVGGGSNSFTFTVTAKVPSSDD